MKLIVAVGLLFAGLVASASASSSSSSHIKSSSSFSSFSTGPGAPLTIPVHSRSDLPTLPESCPGVRLYWNDQIISGIGGVAELLQTFHSGVTIALLPGGDAKCAAATRGLTDGMTLEFVAVYFPIGGVLPKVTDGQRPVWNNTAVVRFSRNMHSGFEHRNWTHSYEIGTMTAAAFNRWMDFPVSFARANPGYELFDVWSSSVDPATRWFNGSYCHSFSVEAMRQAYVINGGGTSSSTVDFSVSKHTLMYRNWVPMLTETAPQVVDLEDPLQLKEVNAFYGWFQALAAKKSIGNIVAFVERLMTEMRDGAFFVYDTPKARYLKVSLVPPYLGVVGMYQPMDLPWQEFVQPACPSAAAVQASPPPPPSDKEAGGSGKLAVELVVCLCVGFFAMGIVAAVGVIKIRSERRERAQKKFFGGGFQSQNPIEAWIGSETAVGSGYGSVNDPGRILSARGY